MPRSLRVVLLSLSAAVLACGFAAGRAAAADAPAGKPQSPVAPQESLRWIALDDGLRIELVAHEPEVVDPVAVRFDEAGRMWVAEYRDYPIGPAAGQKPTSRIKTLEDRDGDGYYETVHVFADELLFCNGIQPWRGGVIATMSGKIAYLKDTDGDHRADVFETWFTGFAEENPQLRVNHPRFGLDNHIYVANGLRGGTAVDARKAGAKPVSLAQHDLRFDPLTFQYEAIAGNGQFGLTFDDYGNRFLCSNRNPLMHVVFEDRYLAMNKNYVVPAVVQDVAAPAEQSKLFPLVDAWVTSILHAGQFTAACGIDIYRGDALPAEYYGNGFTCDPTGSLVHREVLSPAGPTFAGKSPYAGREFLASRDPWFRPVYCDGGPDGALYVVDMYRAVIEHPQYVPVELRNRPDMRLGEDRGRIYRIVAKDSTRDAKRFAPLAQATTAKLVAALEHKNAWWRETAQRLLIERNDKSAVPHLETMSVTGATPQSRVHALWTLQGLGALSIDMLSAAARDGEPRVVEQVLVLAELFPTDGPQPATGIGVDRLLADRRLTFQLMLTAGRVPSRPGPKQIASRGGIVAFIGIATADDPWMRRACVLGAGADAAETLEAVCRPDIFAAANAVPAADRLQLIRELAASAAAQAKREQLKAVYDAAAKGAEQPAGTAVLLAVTRGLAGGLKGSLSDVIGTAWLDLATQVVQDAKSEPAQRFDACDLLAYAPYEQAVAVLLPLFQDADVDLRGRAIAALAAHRDPQIAPLLLTEYAKQTPRFRSQILDAMLGRPERVVLLLDAVEAGKIKVRDLDTARTARLLKSANADVKARAEKLLAASIPADRTKALEDYKKVLALQADPRHGKEVFRKNCATCHKIGDVGVDVGPSIADLRTKTLEQVLTDVIQPNKAIDNNFVTYTVVTVDGTTVVGIVAADTPAGVTLKLADGKTASILKKDIDVMESNGLSLMPEGLEKNIPHQDMADVIAFVKNWRYLDGAVPGLGGAPAKK